MKYDYETEEQFQERVKEAKSRGECIFRDDANREFILDIVDNYMDLVDSLTPDDMHCGCCGYWLAYGEPETPAEENSKILTICEGCKTKTIVTNHIAKTICRALNGNYNNKQCDCCIMNHGCDYQETAKVLLETYHIKLRRDNK